MRYKNNSKSIRASVLMSFHRRLKEPPKFAKTNTRVSNKNLNWAQRWDHRIYDVFRNLTPSQSSTQTHLRKLQINWTKSAEKVFNFNLLKWCLMKNSLDAFEKIPTWSIWTSLGWTDQNDFLYTEETFFKILKDFWRYFFILIFSKILWFF
jgi:hypothetical protein